MKRKPKNAATGGNTRKQADRAPAKPDPSSAPGPAPAVEAELIEPPPRRGRPSKRTPEIEAAIADCLRLGMSIPHTCAACGVSETQFRNWRKHFRDFQELVRRAEAEAVKINLAVIQAAAASGKSWQAAAWFLERKHPEQWGKTETLSIEARKDAVKEAIRIGPARTPEHLRELRAALQLPPDATPALIDAAIEHAKHEATRRAQAEVFGLPYEPRPFDGKSTRTGEVSAKVKAALLGDSGRAAKIAALIELHAKGRAIAGKPPLSEAEAFEAAARELDASAP